MAVAFFPPASHVISMYNFSVIPSFSFMSMRFSLTYCFPSSKVSGVRSLITSSWYSDFPMSAPNEMAIGKPIIPVPGMPTPIAFFKMFADKNALIFSGFCPNSSVARAVQSATAIGSVQPTAGTTCRCIKSMICSRMFFSSISIIN